MMMSKEKFKQAFQAKDYVTCIQFLREEIKNRLTQKIQQVNPDFEYASIPQLKEYSFRYLNDEEKSIALKLYQYSYEEVPEQLELNELLEMYETLEKVA